MSRGGWSRFVTKSIEGWRARGHAAQWRGSGGRGEGEEEREGERGCDRSCTGVVFERRRIRGQVDDGGLGKGRQNHPAGYSHLLHEATDCDGVPPPPPPLFSSSTPRATPPLRVAPAQGLFASCWSGRCCHRDAGRSVAELTELELISRAFYFREVSRMCPRGIRRG